MVELSNNVSCSHSFLQCKSTFTIFYFTSLAAAGRGSQKPFLRKKETYLTLEYVSTHMFIVKVNVKVCKTFKYTTDISAAYEYFCIILKE